MLNVARDNETSGGLILGDIGQGLCFRPGTFDYAIR
jgi:18S rRNA (guanine1575-N7)-methyltransferase